MIGYINHATPVKSFFLIHFLEYPEEKAIRASN